MRATGLGVQDSAWNQCPSVEASTQGPSPVSYWLASMCEMVPSVAATVESLPRRRSDTLTPSAPPTTSGQRHGQAQGAVDGLVAGVDR